MIEIVRKKTSLSRIALYSVLLLAAAALTTGFLFKQDHPADAANLKNFQAGDIISDAVFTNKNAMTQAQIQSFLDGKNRCKTSPKNPNVLTWVNKTKTEGSYTWGGKTYKYYLNNGKFVCMADQKFGGESVAKIIYQAAQDYAINPQVFLVLLEKENGLISDSWPNYNYQYATATGFGCPDSGPNNSANCQSKFFGFKNQIRNAGRMMREIMNGDWTNYPVGNNQVLFNPNTSCGSSNVNIKNRATSALYTYTPYQPNKAALNAGYGTGDSCSAYGNRNFYQYFVDWFGDTTTGEITLYGARIDSPLAIEKLNDSTNVYKVSFNVTNSTDSQLSFDKTVVQCRDHNNKNCDSNYGGAWYIDSGKTRTFSYNIDLSKPGNYTIAPYIQKNGVWHLYDSVAYQKTTHITPELTLNSDLAFNNSTYLAPNKKQTVSFSLKNTGPMPLNIQKTVTQCRYAGKNCDSNYGGPMTIPAGQSRTFSYDMTTMGGGEHTITPYYMVGGQWHTYKGTKDIPSQTKVNVADLELSSPLSVPEDIITGQAFTATYTVKNNGANRISIPSLILQCRKTSGKTNCDPEYTYNSVIEPRAELSFTQNFQFDRSDDVTFTPYYYYQGSWHKYYTNGQFNPYLSRTVTKYTANMKLVKDISVSPVNVNPGDTLLIGSEVQNNGGKTAYYQRSILQCRKDGHINCDPGYNTYGLSIVPGATKAFTTEFKNIQPGNYTFVPYFEQNFTWHRYINNTGSNEKSIFVNPITMTSPIVFESINSTMSRVSFDVTNYSSSRVTFDKTVVQCRNGKRKNCDSNYGGDWYLNPGQTRKFSYTINVSKKDIYDITPYYYRQGKWFTYGHSTGIVPNMKLTTQ